MNDMLQYWEPEERANAWLVLHALCEHVLGIGICAGHDQPGVWLAGHVLWRGNVSVLVATSELAGTSCADTPQNNWNKLPEETREKLSTFAAQLKLLE